MKVCLVGSSGGHLTHLYMLKPFWKDKDRFWVTFDKEDARSLLQLILIPARQVLNIQHVVSSFGWHSNTLFSER